VLQNNASDDLTLTRHGDFRFDTSLKAAHRYNVSVLTQPASVNCSMRNGSSTIVAGKLLLVNVDCQWTDQRQGSSLWLRSRYA